jgi:hypothetical protein
MQSVQVAYSRRPSVDMARKTEHLGTFHEVVLPSHCSLKTLTNRAAIGNLAPGERFCRSVLLALQYPCSPSPCAYSVVWRP